MITKKENIKTNSVREDLASWLKGKSALSGKQAVAAKTNRVLYTKMLDAASDSSKPKKPVQPQPTNNNVREDVANTLKQVGKEFQGKGKIQDFLDKKFIKPKEEARNKKMTDAKSKFVNNRNVDSFIKGTATDKQTGRVAGSFMKKEPDEFNPFRNEVPERPRRPVREDVASWLKGMTGVKGKEAASAKTNKESYKKMLDAASSGYKPIKAETKPQEKPVEKPAETGPVISDAERKAWIEKKRKELIAQGKMKATTEGKK